MELAIRPALPLILASTLRVTAVLPAAVNKPELLPKSREPSPMMLALAVASTEPTVEIAVNEPEIVSSPPVRRSPLMTASASTVAEALRLTF